MTLSLDIEIIVRGWLNPPTLPLPNNFPFRVKKKDKRRLERPEYTRVRYMCMQPQSVFNVPRALQTSKH